MLRNSFQSRNRKARNRRKGEEPFVPNRKAIRPGQWIVHFPFRLLAAVARLPVFNRCPIHAAVITVCRRISLHSAVTSVGEGEVEATHPCGRNQFDSWQHGEAVNELGGARSCRAPPPLSPRNPELDGSLAPPGNLRGPRRYRLIPKYWAGDRDRACSTNGESRPRASCSICLTVSANPEL